MGFLRALTLGSTLLLTAPAATACGYHDNVSLARGILNWTYPDALHVMGAIAQAVIEKRLPAQTLSQDPWRYHHVVRALQRYGRQLQDHSSNARPPTFSLLLIESMLWTRFHPAHGELQTGVHVAAPQAGELVLVSGEDVIGQITRSRLSIGDAHRLGLIRFYGTEKEIELFLALYSEIGTTHTRATNDSGL